MTAHYRIRGLHCSQEAGLIQKKLADLGGVDAVSFEILDEKMTVEARDLAPVEAAVRSLGMGIEPWQEKRGAGSWWERWGQLLFCVISGVAMLAGMVYEAREADNFWLGLLAHEHHHEGGEHHELEAFPLAMFAIAVVAGAWYVVPKAWRALRAKHLDMNILVLIALAGAVALEEYTEAANLAFLFALANLIEYWSLRRAADQIRQIKAEIQHHHHHHHHPKGVVPAQEQFIDRFARWYTPVLLGLGALVALTLPFSAADKAERFEFALMILLTACPCALVISVPVTLAAALASAARHGAFVPHGLALEQAAMSDEALEGLIGQHQVVLKPENQSRFRFLRAHAMRTMSTLKWNVAIAVGAKVAFLALASMNKASLWMAVASDVGAMLVVTLIGLQLLKAVEPSSVQLRAEAARSGLPD